MIKLQEVVGLPNLQYHLDNKLTLSECVYRYSSDSFIQLFAEARQALRDGKITLNEQDLDLLETTDIGGYGMYEGQKVPLDLPTIDEVDYDSLEDEIANNEFGMDYNQLGPNEKEWVDDEIANLNEANRNTHDIILTFDDERRINRVKTTPIFQKMLAPNQMNNLKVGDNKLVVNNVALNGLERMASTGLYTIKKDINEAKHRGKDVPLNKPKRGGSKKFYVYTKNKKGNVVKVSFGGTTGLNVKIDEPGARSSFAARHQCDTKKDKTKPGYWACNIGRYWKSLGGNKNFSGYW